MELPVVEKRITLDKMRRYTGGGPGIHTDEEFARKKGLPGAVVQGGQVVGYLNEMMLRALGQGYVEGGEISVVFVKSALAGDVLATRGTVKEERQVDGRTQVEFEVWVENQRGEKLAVGTASGLLPEGHR
jgi:acyl dehydratase